MKTATRIGIAGAMAFALGLSACSSAAPEDSAEATSATILTNWFAQAEQGGYWAAQAEGLAEDRGVDLTVMQGGPGIQTIPQVAAGEADFGVGNADEVLVAVASGLPIVAVTAGPAKNLQCMAYHESTGIEGFGDLNGHTVARVPSPYWDYIRTEFDLNDVHEINIGDLASFQNDENLVTQCFLTSEPYTIEEMGIEGVGYLSVADDGGYNAYQNLLYTTQDFIDQHPDVVEAVVQASNEGWQAMLDDPTATKALIMETNPDGDPGVFDYAVGLFKSDPSLLGDDIGSMSAERWAELNEQLQQIELVPAGFDETAAYTTEFLD